MRFACWIAKANDTHSQQQWLRERASMLPLYAHYIERLVVLWDRILPGDILTGISKGSFEVYQYLNRERQISIYRSITCDTRTDSIYKGYTW
jgi:hypothetical protein